MITTVLAVLLAFETFLLISGILVGITYLKRLFAYDELFQYLQDDLDINIQNFDKLKSTPMMSNAPEIIHASKLMSTMRDRLYEYVMRIEENALRGRAELKIPRDSRGVEEVPRS
jgi:hypothetical protein